MFFSGGKARAQKDFIFFLCRKHVVRSCEGGQRGAWRSDVRRGFVGGSEKLDVVRCSLGPYHKYSHVVDGLVGMVGQRRLTLGDG